MKWGTYESKEDIIDKAKPFASEAVEKARLSTGPDRDTLLLEMLDHEATLKRLFPLGKDSYHDLRVSKYQSALRILEYTSAKAVEN